MSREQLVVQQIEEKKRQIKQVKNTISNLKARNHALSSQPVIRSSDNLRKNLQNILSPEIMPQNVGYLNGVAWQFQYIVDFDLSETSQWPTLTAQTTQARSFQVSQEAAFLLTGISRHSDDYGAAGDLGPLTLELRDRQSSRFFNNEPIPIQMIGQKGYQTRLGKPMIILPNAFFEITLSTFLDDGIIQNIGNGETGKHSFIMHGYRVRTEDAKKVLSTIFG